MHLAGQAILEDHWWHQTNVVGLLLGSCLYFPEESEGLPMTQVPWLVDLDNVLQGVDWPLVRPVRVHVLGFEPQLESALVVGLWDR